MSVVVEKLEAALESKELHDLKLQREYEQEEMRKALGYECGEIIRAADPPLIYKSVKELKDLVSKGFPVNSGKTFLSINDKGEVSERIGIEACLKERCGHLYRTHKKGFKVHIRTQFLTPLIDYTVNLVFCKDNYSMKQKYVALRYKLEGETETSIVYLANKTKDNRSLIAELYQFTSNGRTFDLDIVFENHKDNLEVEGILLQPLEKVEHEQALEDEEVSNDSLQWTMEEKDSGTKLLKCFHIDKGQEGYAVDKNGKKSLIFSAKGIIRSRKLSFKPLPESRFQEVAVITKSRFYIKIKSKRLTPETTYACYLVYKLNEDQPVLENVYEDSYIYVIPPDTPIIGQKLDRNTHNQQSNRPKLDYVPRQRSDGWMEVKVWQKQTPSSAKTTEIDIWLRTPNWNDVSGLMIQSIELRPIVAHST